MHPSLLIKIFLIAGTVFVSGCVGLGVGVLGNERATLTKPRISIEKGIVAGDSKASTPWITADDLRRYWGAPDSIERVSQDTELWRYDFGLRWNGLGLLVAFIPIPLMVPVGHEYIEFTIENKSVEKARTEEHTWIAMYGCVASGIPHAQGTECVFQNGPRSPRPESFSTASQPEKQGTASKIIVANATTGAVTVAHRDKFSRSEETRFTLAPRQSRNILTHTWEGLVAIDGSGKTLTVKDKFPQRYGVNSAIFYLILENHISPVPPKYWDNWETHIQEIIDIEKTSK